VAGFSGDDDADAPPSPATRASDDAATKSSSNDKAGA
jgi:hypothetical protein